MNPIIYRCAVPTDGEIPAVIRPGEAVLSRPDGARGLSAEDRALIGRVLRDGDWLLQRLAKR